MTWLAISLNKLPAKYPWHRMSLFIYLFKKKRFVQKLPQKWIGKKRREKKKTRTTWLSGACKTERSCLPGGQSALRRDLVLHFQLALLPSTNNPTLPVHRSAVPRQLLQVGTHFVIFVTFQRTGEKDAGGEKKKRCEASATMFGLRR